MQIIFKLSLTLSFLCLAYPCPAQSHEVHPFFDAIKNPKYDDEDNLQAIRWRNYTIFNLWNGDPDIISDADNKDGNQVRVFVHDTPFIGAVTIGIDAPFYNDPAPPNGEHGQPYYGLWDYEVAEAFFLCSETEQYLELEFGPHGEHLGLFLNGHRNEIANSLPLTFYTYFLNISDSDPDAKRWHGVAEIPYEYFPPNVNKFNAYAIHNQQIQGEEPIYKAFSPSSGEVADFHDLESFADFNTTDLAPTLANITELSEVWKDAINTGGTTNEPTGTTVVEDDTTVLEGGSENIKMLSLFVCLLATICILLI